PTVTSRPVTPAPTPAPTAPSALAQPINFAGMGQTATDAVTPNCAICRVSITHSGSRNFIVKTFRGSNQDLIVNTIGSYQGSRPLFGRDPVIFDIDADGTWTIHIEEVSRGGQAPFSGQGDAVSDLFEPPDTKPWQ